MSFSFNDVVQVHQSGEYSIWECGKFLEMPVIRTESFDRVDTTKDPPAVKQADKRIFPAGRQGLGTALFQKESDFQPPGLSSA